MRIALFRVSVRRLATGISLVGALLTVGLPSASAFGGPSSRWSLAGDFRIAPDQQNPSSDAYGHPGVWSYMQSTGDSHDPTTYSLLPVFQTNEDGVTGLEDWTASPCSEGSDCFPHIGINATGSDQILNGGTVAWPTGAILVHPSPTNMAVVGWTSPINGRVTMSGSFDLVQQPNCGNGVVATLDNGARTLATFLVTPTQPITSFELRLVVHRRNAYFLTINSNQQDYGCDSTVVTWTINRHKW
jgi:hypothetical protein